MDWQTQPRSNLLAALRRACSGLGAGVSISTAELNNLIGGDAWSIRQITELASSGRLPDVVTRGAEVRTRQNTLKRPWLWHAPHVQCPHCGGVGWAAPGKAPLVHVVDGPEVAEPWDAPDPEGDAMRARAERARAEEAAGPITYE